MEWAPESPSGFLIPEPPASNSVSRLHGATCVSISSYDNLPSGSSKVASLSSPPMKSSSGFTLIELLVTIGVASILAAIAIPAFNNFVMNDRDATQINSLVASLNYARSMAVKLNTRNGVEVCPSSDGQTCNAPARGWADGWVVLDMTNPLAPIPLQAVPALSLTNRLTATGAGANAIIFRSNGTVSRGPVITTAQIKVCDPRGTAFARDVEVSPVGSISSSQTPGQSATGAALACP
jgi:type IV fimbrial biogenesis protein FimT